MSADSASARQARAQWLSALCGFAIMAQHVGGKAIRDGIFLSRFSVAQLPTAMLLSALLAVPIVLGVSMAMTRLGPGLVAPLVLCVSAALFGLEWLLLPRFPDVTALLLYLHVATLGGTVISTFWSIMSERFDPHTAKQAIFRVTNGIAIGGLVGGLLMTWAAHDLSPRELLLALALVNTGCAIAVSRISTHGAAPMDAVDLATPLGALRKSPYLRAIASLVLLTGFVSALLDFSFKAEASKTFAGGPALLQLFAVFHTGTAVLTALVQTVLARRALERLGLAGTLALLPATVLLTGALGVSVPRLWSNVLLRGASSVIESSLFRSAYEPLYTPLSPALRRSSKTVIDVAIGRLGEALGSGSALLLVWVLFAHAGGLVIVLAMIGAALSLLLSIRLHRGYVAELATSLRTGAVRLRESDIIDSTTRLTLSQTQIEISRDELLAQIAALRAGKPQPSDEPAAAHSADRESGPVSLVASEPAIHERLALASPELLAATTDLLSADTERIARMLARGPLDPRLCAFAIPLLQRRELLLPVTNALKRIAPAVIGQLVDALHDPEQPAMVRQRLPRVIKSVASPRAAQGLAEALRANERNVRHRAALALADLAARNPELAPARNFVFEAARAEIRSADGPLDLHHMFSILGLAIDREGLLLARKGLASGDARQRGTALEYLQNVLPEPVRSELVAQLEQRTA